MLPSSLDSERLQQIAIGLLVVLVVMAFLVVRFVRKVTMKLGLLLIMAGLGFVIWAQRADLSQCSQICDCHLFGQQVHVPKVGCDSQPGS